MTFLHKPGVKMEVIFIEVNIQRCRSIFQNKTVYKPQARTVHTDSIYLDQLQLDCTPAVVYAVAILEMVYYLIVEPGAPNLFPVEVN